MSSYMSTRLDGAPYRATYASDGLLFRLVVFLVAMASCYACCQTILMDDIANWRVDLYCGGAGNRGVHQGPKFQTMLSGVVVFDSKNNGYVADGSCIKIVTADGHVRILTGQPEVTGNTDGPPGAATFGEAIDIALASDDVLYVVDSANLTLRMIERRDGVWLTSTVAGVPGQAGHRDGPLGQSLFAPVFDSVTVDPSSGIVYLFQGDWIRKYESGVVTTLNPDGGTGYRNGPIASARFAHSQGRYHGITYDGKGSLYVADKVNMAIRRIDLAKGEVSTIAGVLPGIPKERPRDAPNALDARFHPGGGPNVIFYSAAVDALILRSDDEGGAIRIIRDGSMKTFSSKSGKSLVGPLKDLSGGLPCGVDKEGGVYITGPGCIRKAYRSAKGTE